MQLDTDMINQEVEELIDKITSSLRGVDSLGKKSIDEEAVKALFLLLEQMKEFIRNEEVVNKRFVALLFYLYRQIHTEAMYTDYPEPIFMLSGQVESYVDELFGKFFD